MSDNSDPVSIGHEIIYESECYAIRQKSTGYYLPIRWKSSRGYSYDEPAAGAFPRLFKSWRSANAALIAWCQGEWKQEAISSGDYGENIEYAPIPDDSETKHRRKDDMEIVTMILTER